MLNKKIKGIAVLYHNNVRWINISQITAVQIGWLKKNFNFEDNDINDCRPTLQRPKMTEHPDYLFMILHFPLYDRLNGEIKASEMDFFIGKDFLITINNDGLPPLQDLWQQLEKNIDFRDKTLKDNPEKLLFTILNNSLHYCFPMLNHINLDMETVEQQIMNIHEKKMTVIKEILRIKRNIFNFRKIMQAHRGIISKLVARLARFCPAGQLTVYLRNLTSHTKDIWEFLEIYKDTINALHETHQSLVSSRLNEIIKTLTIFSVIIFPLTLVATIFSMNTTGGMPFLGHQLDFWLVMITLMVLAGIMLSFFKWRRWL